MAINNHNNHIGRFLALQHKYNKFEPITLNLISTPELTIVLVEFSYTYLLAEKIIIKSTPDYHYFESGIRIPVLERTNVRPFTYELDTSLTKKINYVTKLLVTLKKITAKDRLTFEKIMFGQATLPVWTDLVELLSLSAKNVSHKLSRTYNMKVQPKDEVLICTS